MANKQLDDLHEEFKDWNPMKDDHLDSKFNLYDSGPGAALDAELQPAELAKKQNGLQSIVDPYLIFQNLPKDMTSKSIKNICQRFVNVKEVNKTAKSVFVKFDNIADMESVYRGMNNNEYGLKVIIGGHFAKERKNNVSFEAWQERGFNIQDIPAPSVGVDMDRRKILPSEKNPPRPKLKEQNIIKIDEENSTIAKNDPLHHVLKEGDAHDLERAGLGQTKVHVKCSDEYEYHTGRAFINMPSEIKNYFEEVHKKSNGTYDAKKDVYRKNDKENVDTIHRCLVCKKPSDVTCDRCNPNLSIYCSKKCQRSNWEDHRKICGHKKVFKNASPPPRASTSFSSDNLSDSPITTESQNHLKREKTQKSPAVSTSSSNNDSFTSQSFPTPDMPSTKSVVVMTAISKVNLVFVRSKSEQDNMKYFETISQIQAAAKRQRPLKKLPTTGQAVIAKFGNSEQYGRALVLQAADEENIKINFLDYGNTEVQKLSNLCRIPKDFIQFPRFAVPVILKDVPNYYMTKEVRSFMYTYLRDIDLVLKYDKEEDLIPITNVYQVDLYDKSTNQHLNKFITELCKPKVPTKFEELTRFEYLEFVPLPVGKNIQYYIMDNSTIKMTGCICCTTKDFALEIEKFSEDIQRYANSLKQLCYTPNENELCIAKYSLDGRWYRGRCMEKVGDGQPSIHFIDYGNISFVKVADIRPYPQKFEWPIYTGDFAIQGLPEVINEKLAERLEELLPCCYPIQCDYVESKDGNFYILTLNEIIKKLKNEKLID